MKRTSQPFFFKDMGLIFRGLIVLPVWLGKTRTRPSPPRCLLPPPDNILPMQIMTSSFHHFAETVQGLIKALIFIMEMTLKRRYFNISLTDGGDTWGSSPCTS
ncbi:UNVERIFIED_CONTAM: hypothetical protein NCL1_54261 [Trichonephila clavipes]